MEKNKRSNLDLHVRYWDNNVVKTFYVGSQFLGLSKASDLCKHLMPYIENFGFHNLLQISMDGPNVNWSAYEMLAKEIETQRFQENA